LNIYNLVFITNRNGQVTKSKASCNYGIYHNTMGNILPLISERL
jgi:hypothetical protein